MVLASSAWALITALSTSALAAGETRVVVIGRSEQDPIVARIELELGLLGLGVEFVRAAGGTGDLPRVARDHDAAAAVMVEQRPAAVRIWTDPARVPGASDVETRSEDTGGGNAMLALMAVEFLRGRLVPAAQRGAGRRPDGRGDDSATDRSPTSGSSALPTGSSVDGARSKTPANANGGKSAARGGGRDAAGSAHGTRDPHPFSGFVGASVLASPGGLGALPGVWLGARWVAMERVEVHFWSVLPLTTFGVEAPEGNIGLRIGGVGGSVCYVVLPATARGGRGPFAAAGLGMGGLYASYSGSVTAPSSAGAAGTQWISLPHARASFGYWISGHVAVRADGLVGVALPQIVVRSDARSVATFGYLSTTLALSLEASL